ncbi:ribonucleotide-diphosphate reductase subunit beta [Truepera radiovictrix]|uniref:ribonucleoside-diphosphate reductase n=1 Tax=Truepera radiovictrix (strain DSM 17093 / CIP 108686 / LMG 22925 / RQ-24) TaxID=649638 RepID=D7CXC4_TRURR|nr:ribonucleotide-diphosphate reductase subunit beta [Truepera radiovictrix]ADI13248.1 ribonucleotide reductase [Truepera radiovictrix DSM 17093]WMT58188.1 ribonucleotide-diphosphate reductase subunit beta [Truepera radiovictrix]
MLTERRSTLRPAEYPEFLAYRDAIRHSYWLHTEYNLTEDVNDYRVGVREAERQVLTRALLAIAQVEVAVKTFWGDLYRKFPKPEVGAVGYTFAESEVRHQDAYAHLLELLGLTDAFARLHEAPALGERLAVLDAHLVPVRQDGRDDAFSVALFSAFVEHVSLFGQFLILKAFNQATGRFKGVANIVEATSKEEQIHGMFGYKLVETLRRERPEWFGAAFSARLRAACVDAERAERAILRWICEAGALPFLPLAQLEAFMQARFNGALVALGEAPLWEVDPALLAPTRWFEEELLSSKQVDFFHKRPTAYAKKTRPITADDLFAV